MAVQAATAVAAEAQAALDDAVAECAPTGAGGGKEPPWDVLTALLTPLEAIPAAIRSGNGEAACASMQDNGLRQLQSIVNKRVLSHAAPADCATPAASPVPSVQRIAAEIQQRNTAQPLFRNAGMDGLKGIFTSAGTKSGGQTT